MTASSAPKAMVWSGEVDLQRNLVFNISYPVDICGSSYLHRPYRRGGLSRALAKSKPPPVTTCNNFIQGNHSPQTEGPQNGALLLCDHMEPMNLGGRGK